MQAGCTNLYISVRVCVCMMVSLKIDLLKTIAKPLRHTSKLNISKISVCLHVNSLCTFNGGMSTQIDKVHFYFAIKNTIKNCRSGFTLAHVFSLPAK